MITAENVSYQEIIKDISFEIPDRGVVGLVGPNGSGKGPSGGIILTRDVPSVRRRKLDPKVKGSN